jgi:protein arginine N-methyltransferase 7
MKKPAKKTIKITESPPSHRKPTKKERDEHFAAHIPGVLNYHALMLADGLRNKLLSKAIKQNVNSDTNFLDIGAGTGVWAILAAKLGAKRVVAVEIEECLIPIIYKHAQENGVADRIEIVHGNSNDVKLKGRFDVIVSELFGGDALGEGTVKSFVDIRNRFLAPDGVLIPQKLTLMAAPAFAAKVGKDLPKSLPLTANFLRSLRLNYSQHLSIADRGDVKLLAEPKPLIELDFRNTSEAPNLENLTASWKLNNVKRANAIITFNHSGFTDSIEMDSFGSQSWGASLSEFTPFDTTKGELFFRTSLDPEHGNWTVAVPGDPSLKPQNFSQVFAFTRLRMTQKMTPHKRFKPRELKPEAGKQSRT